MKILALLSFSLLMGAAFLNSSAPVAPVAAPPKDVDRSPSDVALTADGSRAVTANTTSDSVSLTDLTTGSVLAEASVGKHPFAVALAKDGSRAVVTNKESNSISILEVGEKTLRPLGAIPVGDEPRGVALSGDGKQAFVALAGDNAVAVVDLAAKKVVERIKVGTEPWHVALTPDGKNLAVGNARSQDMSVIDAAERKVRYTVRMRGRNLRTVAIAPDGEWAYVPYISEQGRPTTKDNIDQGWVIASRLGRVSFKEESVREAIALDTPGKAVGDVDGVAISPDGNTLAVTAGGTHELLLFRQPLPFVGYGGPGDFIDVQLKNDAARFRRIPLGGRPLGVRFLPDGKRVVVANYLSNALQLINVAQGTVEQTIVLGGPLKPSLAREGEAIFMDATRSFHEWYSCNTCHVEGHTGGGNFDTFNDGSYNTSKKTLSLRGVTQTGPWTWHGWQKSLRDLVHDSATKSMQGPEPTDHELDAVLAYLATLEFRPNPHRNSDGSLTDAAKRGEALFNARGCNTCHAPPDYTTPAIYKVGLESPEDAYVGFNPPSLRGVYSRSPYLHDGSVYSLEVVMKKHRPSQLTGKPDFTPEELPDLIAFLKSL